MVEEELGRLSNLIDLKLDNIENKDAYNDKEREINEKLRVLNIKIDKYESIKDSNTKMLKQLKQIESIILDSEKPLKEFDKTCFDRFFDKIIIGEVDENGNINPNAVRFILKLGGDYIGNYNEKTNRIDDVSFVTGNRFILS